MTNKIATVIPCVECQGKGKKDLDVYVLDIVGTLNYYPETQRLQAIRAIRDRYGMGLRISKEIVDAYEDFIECLTQSLTGTKSEKGHESNEL